MKKYKVSYTTIEEVEVKKESESFIWTIEGRFSKKVGWRKYFDLYDDAVNYIINDAEKKCNIARKSLMQYEEDLSSIKKKFGRS